MCFQYGQHNLVCGLQTPGRSCELCLLNPTQNLPSLILTWCALELELSSLLSTYIQALAICVKKNIFFSLTLESQNIVRVITIP